jgi:hypothetical protein
MKIYAYELILSEEEYTNLERILQKASDAGESDADRLLHEVQTAQLVRR